MKREEEYEDNKAAAKNSMQKHLRLMDDDKHNIRIHLKVTATPQSP